VRTVPFILPPRFPRFCNSPCLPISRVFRALLTSRCWLQSVRWGHKSFAMRESTPLPLRQSKAFRCIDCEPVRVRIVVKQSAADRQELSPIQMPLLISRVEDPRVLMGGTREQCPLSAKYGPAGEPLTIHPPLGTREFYRIRPVLEVATTAVRPQLRSLVAAESFDVRP
jgi:hypothetical protein